MSESRLIQEKDIKEIIEVLDQVPISEIEGKVFLLTGVTGFIGSNILRVLIYLNDMLFNEKCKMIVCCRDFHKLYYKFGERIKKNDIEIYEESLMEKICLKRAVNYIIHMASNSVTKSFSEIPVETLLINALATNNLLEYARKFGCESFLFFSSGAIYGTLGAVRNISEDDCGTVDHLNVVNTYAVGKRMGEALCNAYFHEFHVNTKIIRISHTYGPGIDIEDGRVFSDFAKKIYMNRDLVIKGTGMDVRPYCYITDAISAIFLVLVKGSVGECYNMANDEETYDVKELAEILCNKGFPEKELNIKFDLINRYQKLCAQKINTSKLRGLGWKPKVDVVTGFQRTVASIQ